MAILLVELGNLWEWTILVQCFLNVDKGSDFAEVGHVPVISCMDNEMMVLIENERVARVAQVQTPPDPDYLFSVNLIRHISHKRVVERKEKSEMGFTLAMTSNVEQDQEEIVLFDGTIGINTIVLKVEPQLRLAGFEQEE